MRILNETDGRLLFGQKSTIFQLFLLLIYPLKPSYNKVHNFKLVLSKSDFGKMLFLAKSYVLGTKTQLSSDQNFDLSLEF